MRSLTKEKPQVLAFGDWVATGTVPKARELFDAGYHGRSYNEHHEVPWNRGPITTDFAFAIPSAEAIALLLAQGPLLEVGAGTGAWAAIIAKRGGDIIATDVKEAGKKSSYGQYVGRHHTVVTMEASAAVAAFPDRTVFCSWPSYDEPWFTNALKLICTRGRRCVVIGESDGGCTGDAGLFELLEAEWTEIATAPMPQWPGIHDELQVFEYRGRRP